MTEATCTVTALSDVYIPARKSLCVSDESGIENDDTHAGPYTIFLHHDSVPMGKVYLIVQNGGDMVINSNFIPGTEGLITINNPVDSREHRLRLSIIHKGRC